MSTWASTEFCKVTDVQAYFRDVPHLLATETSDPSVNSQIQEKIDLAKDDLLRPEVVLLAQKVFPTTVDNLKRLGRARYRQYLSHISADDQLNRKGSLQAATVETQYELWFNETNGTIKPRVWTHAGTPGATTLTSAVNGDFCVDSTNELMYINRSTVAGTPDWERFTAESAHDYIYNPTELKRWNVLEAALLCLEDREFRNFLSGNDDMLTRMQDRLSQKLYGALDSYGKPVESMPGAKKLALSLLKFDISDDGLLSDYESGATTSLYVPFV